MKVDTRISLDDARTYQTWDPTDMGVRLDGLPDQCRRAWRQVMAFDIPAHYRNVNKVVILGAGGSAIGGEMLADLAALQGGTHIQLCQDYTLPCPIDGQTLVIASSNSGNTEETLAAFRQAIAKGAKAVAMTTGGALLDEAGRHGVPVFKLESMGEPRCAVGYSLLVPLGLLTRLGLVQDSRDDVTQAIGDLETAVARLGRHVPSTRNLAKELAQAFLGRLPVIYGGGIFRGVAHRWKTQLNENAKVWAVWDMIPEVNHNAVVGYARPEAVRKLVLAVLLKPGYLHERVALRYQPTNDLLNIYGVESVVIEGQGGSPIAQVLLTTLLGDYISYYLAMLQGLDPSPTGPIDTIKTHLKQHSDAEPSAAPVL
jgi:glucose/mannose-6-phosphate isomerase